MVSAVILAAGKGEKIWPFGEVRPKPLIPVANKPLIDYSVSALLNLGFTDIIIAAGQFSDQFSSLYRDIPAVKVIKCGVLGDTQHDARELIGTAETLRLAWSSCIEDRILVLYGDVLLHQEDIESLVGSFERENAGSASPGTDRAAAALISSLGEEDSRDWICCAETDGKITGIFGHSRDNGTHRFCGFIFDRKVFHVYLEYNSGVFAGVDVGAMPPLEKHLEISLADYLKDGGTVEAVAADNPVFDVDKPWHILEANESIVKKLCGALKNTEKSSGASIDPSADIGGYVGLGENSRIGRNVTIKGNVLIGENTVVENGVVINGNAVIGDNCYLGNYCYIEDNSTIGDRCVVNHCAELNGIILENVFLYHYMELCGVVGMNTDLGAATVCGTLRFDDGNTVHRVRGRKEYPRSFTNAVYLGDCSRTGVNVILLPGSKVGSYSVVGPGVVVSEDIPSRTSVFVKQEIVKKEWGPERYGW